MNNKKINFEYFRKYKLTNYQIFDVRNNERIYCYFPPSSLARRGGDGVDGWWLIKIEDDVENRWDGLCL